MQILFDEDRKIKNDWFVSFHQIRCIIWREEALLRRNSNRT